MGNSIQIQKGSPARKIHIIGICGVLTSAIASAFNEIGWTVTGSDKGFYPPTSTQLDKLGIEYYAGWHPEKMVAGGNPDIVVVATASGSQNPETLYAKEYGIKCLSYTDIVRDYIVRENSIVCAGTWGKTTSSMILSYIMEKAGLDPSYMFGGISLSQDLSAKITESKWSVLEGDEYKSGPTDNTAKFFYYKPGHLLLSALSWDHADLYPTEQAYMAVFEKLLMEDSVKHIVYCIDNKNLKDTVTKVIKITGIASIFSYGKDHEADYVYSDVVQDKDGIKFSIEIKDKDQEGQNYQTYTITSPMLGKYNAENITGCFAMAHSIGINPEKIISAISDFKGIKRRMERRYRSADKNSDLVVFDSHAPTADKARTCLESLREIYPKNKIVTVFEPNIGGRKLETIAMYDHAFKDADLVLIPHLSKLKIDTTAKVEDLPIEGQILTEYISKTQKNSFYIEDDTELVERLVKEAKDDKNTVIIFLGSHGFRGMMEDIVKRLQ